MTRASSFAPRAHRAGPHRHQQGFSLIEVLVSILIFSLGVLGLVGLQAQATRYSIEAAERSRAALMANDLVAAMWGAQSTTVPTATLNAWTARLQDDKTSGLPSATRTISAPDAAGTVTITINWTSVARGASGPSSKYVTQVTLPGAP